MFIHLNDLLGKVMLIGPDESNLIIELLLVMLSYKLPLLTTLLVITLLISIDCPTLIDV